MSHRTLLAMLLAPLLVACAGETLAEPVGTVTPTSTVRPASATASPTAVRTAPVTALTAAPTVVATARPATPAPTPTRTPAPVTPAPPPPPPPTSNCDPSYPDVCIPRGAADYDCAGGTGNGPNYIRGPIRVLPPDPHDLDRDGNGIGCQ